MILRYPRTARSTIVAEISVRSTFSSTSVPTSPRRSVPIVDNAVLVPEIPSVLPPQPDHVHGGEQRTEDQPVGFEKVVQVERLRHQVFGERAGDGDALT